MTGMVVANSPSAVVRWWTHWSGQDSATWGTQATVAGTTAPTSRSDKSALWRNLCGCTTLRYRESTWWNNQAEHEHIAFEVIGGFEQWEISTHTHAQRGRGPCTDTQPLCNQRRRCVCVCVCVCLCVRVRACVRVFSVSPPLSMDWPNPSLDDLMGLLRVMMPPKLQLLALLAFAVAMFFLENQIQKLEESRGKLGKLKGLQPDPRNPPVMGAKSEADRCITFCCAFVSVKGSTIHASAYGSDGATWHMDLGAVLLNFAWLWDQHFWKLQALSTRHLNLCSAVWDWGGVAALSLWPCDRVCVCVSVYFRASLLIDLMIRSGLSDSSPALCRVREIWKLQFPESHNDVCSFYRATISPTPRDIQFNNDFFFF